MIHLVERSKWAFDTSGSAGLSLDVVAAEGGVVKLFDPQHMSDPKRPPVVFHYGGVGVGISTPGLKIPKLGNVIARQLIGRALNGGASGTQMWNEGWIFKTPAVGSRELVRSDFVGACILAEAGISTPIKGRTGSMFLVGLDPVSLLMATSPPMMVAEIAMGRGAGLSPRAVIFSYGDSRGLVAGGQRLCRIHEVKGMRTTITLLIGVGVILLLLAGGLAWRAHGIERSSVVAQGVVTALNEGPYHAEVEVAGADGHKFTYVENSSHAPLAVGEAVAVRYLPTAPAETAHVATGGVYGLATSVAVTGALIILAAWLSPFLTSRFPGVFVFPIRR